MDTPIENGPLSTNMAPPSAHLPMLNPDAATAFTLADQASDAAPRAGGSSTKDFTKRRNWPQQIFSGILDLITVLSPDARFLYLSPSCKQITGYEPADLVGSFITHFAHPQDHALFVREFNEAIMTGNPLRFHLRFRKATGIFTVLELIGHPHMSTSFSAQGMFMTIRPYPTGKIATVDAFLEHKMMSVELREEVAELKKQLDIEESLATMPLPYPPDLQNLHTVGTDLLETTTQAAQSGAIIPSDIAPPAPVPSHHFLDDNTLYSGPFFEPENTYLNGPRTSENYDLAFPPEFTNQMMDSQQTMMNPDMYAGATSIEPFSPGVQQPPGHERVCHDCGVSESPEWRRGPNGPKTLCNACGLRWAKMQRKNASET